MRNFSRVVSTVLVAWLTVTGLAHAQSQSPGRAALVERFNERVEAYVATHRKVEQLLPRQQIFTDPAGARRAMAAMARAMRAVRPDAREGDIFDREVGALFLDDIWRALRAGGIDPEELAAEMVPEMPGEYEIPKVNGNFSWALANAMPPCVLRALPELPIELQYRFVQFDLVLIDLHANLVVDILRDVLPGEDARFVEAAQRGRLLRSRSERFTQCD